MWRAGDLVGDLEIVAPLRGGGMAALLLARRVGASGFARHVAVKVIHDHLVTDPEMVRLFIDEARLQARIRHPQVVHVEQLGTQEGRHFLVMEFVHGVSLSQLLTALRKRELRLSPALAVALAMEVLAGLHAAHEVRGDDGEPLGAVHRDVSPQNVLVSREGHVKLIDFGIAKARDRLSQTTGQGLRGKIRYMSPEQASGRPIDRRSDVYALGIVLWETLTLRRRFRADSELAVLDAVRRASPEPAARWVPDLPPAVDAVLARAMASAPEDRFATAQDMRRALGDALPEARAVEPEHLAAVVELTLGLSLDDQLTALPCSPRALWSGAPPRLALVEERGLLLSVDTDVASEVEHGPTPSEVEPARPLLALEREQTAPSLQSEGSASGALGFLATRRVRRAWLWGGVALVVFGAFVGWMVWGSPGERLPAPEEPTAAEARGVDPAHDPAHDPVHDPAHRTLHDAPSARTPRLDGPSVFPEVPAPREPDVSPNARVPEPTKRELPPAVRRRATRSRSEPPALRPSGADPAVASMAPTRRPDRRDSVPGTFTDEF